MRKLIVLLLVAVFAVALLAPSASAWDSNIRYTETLRNPIDWEMEDGGWSDPMFGLGDGYMPSHGYPNYFAPFVWEFWSWWSPWTQETSFWPFMTKDTYTGRTIENMLLK